MRRWAEEHLDRLFPGQGALVESIIYDFVERRRGEKCNWDYYQFREMYKRRLQCILENAPRITARAATMSLASVVTADCRTWEPTMHAIDTGDDVDSDEDQREGTFTCGNCARKGDYPRNTSHYEKQTRSADEPMTVFMHCHTCGKDYRFSS